jgi:hypothetical protein
MKSKNFLITMLGAASLLLCCTTFALPPTLPVPSGNVEEGGNVNPVPKTEEATKGGMPPAPLNDVSSSTMFFESAGGYTLTDNGDGTYTGVIPMKVDGGFDIYGEEGATAWFGDDPGTGPVWTSQAIGSDHDAWPTWTPDTPDWYQYSLNLYEDGGVQKWALRNHPAATAANPWYDTAFWGSALPPCGVPRD